MISNILQSLIKVTPTHLLVLERLFKNRLLIYSIGLEKSKFIKLILVFKICDLYIYIYIYIYIYNKITEHVKITFMGLF
jgi:hypothetical protein